MRENIENKLDIDINRKFVHFYERFVKSLKILVGILYGKSYSKIILQGQCVNNEN